MKKFILFILLAGLLFQEAQAAGCDQTFYGQLRAGGIYTFWDDLTNVSSNPLFVNLTTTTFVPEYNYGANPTFSESSLVANSHIWSPGETGRVVDSSQYTIGGHPPTRSNSNLVITYDIVFSQQVNGVWGAGQSHKECKFYEITWCGDGIVDTTEGEQCDLGAQNGQAGSTCSASCTPVIVPPSVNGLCNSAYNGGTFPGPYTWASIAPTACTSGTPAPISGWPNGPWAWSCNGIGGGTSVNCSANVTTSTPICGDGIRNGSESCDPNDLSHNGWGTATPGCSVSCTPVNIVVTPPVCGDGIVNGSEQCDLGAQNGQAGSACSASCTPVIAATCTAGSVTGPQSVAPSAATPGLCPAGQSVGAFSATPAGTVTNYSWSCNGLSGGNCSASFTALGAACTPGPVTGPQATTVTAATVGLCPVGQTVSAFTSTVAGAVTNHSWACAGSNAGGLCTASSPTVSTLCIPGPTTGLQRVAVTATTPGLCLGGPASVSNFASIAFGTITNYIWSCDGSIDGGACAASFTAVGAACIPGPITGPQPAAITAATVGLCPAGQTVGDFTPVVAGAVTNYSWSCAGSLIGSVSGGTCTASSPTVIVVPPPPPPPGGGGGGPVCTPGAFTRSSGNVVPAPINQNTFGLCQPNEAVGNFVDAPTGGTNHRYSWSCAGIGAGLDCTAYYNGVTGFTPPGGSITVPGANSYCGNGAVERPNAAGQYENCDTSASWCVSCSIASTNPGSVVPGKITITNPGSSPLDINTYRLIVGNGVPVFSLGDRVFFETHQPMYLQNKTATVTNKSALIGGSTVTKIISNKGVGGLIREETGRTHDLAGNVLTITYNETLYPDTLQLFDGSELQNFKGDTSTIVGSSADIDKTLPMSLGSGLYASLQYLEVPFNIRVSKPAISNTAGGSAFVGSFLGYSVNNVVDTFMNNLKSGNFTTSTVNIGSASELSSATSTVSGNAWLNQVISSGSTSEIGNIARSSTGITGNSTSTSIISTYNLVVNSEPMEDSENIRVFKNGNVSIDSPLGLAGVKTIIIENGDLEINKNIFYDTTTFPSVPSSYAFIVKRGNIIIAKDVTNIAGVFVALDGNIRSDGESTPNRLTVEGSLYGNTSDLVENRTYVRGQTGYSALNVGVVVNYSNRAIMYPPPFLSRFLDQYSLQRVSR